MRKILERCPTCGGEFEIRDIQCRQCGTEIHSHYDPCPFCRLTGEQIRFLELFVQAKGNMRLLEQTLGVSYPTVRSRVETIAAIMRVARPDVPMPVDTPRSAVGSRPTALDGDGAGLPAGLGVGLPTAADAMPVVGGAAPHDRTPAAPVATNGPTAADDATLTPHRPSTPRRRRATPT